VGNSKPVILGNSESVLTTMDGARLTYSRMSMHNVEGLPWQ
jgi:hypothetical protein